MKTLLQRQLALLGYKTANDHVAPMLQCSNSNFPSLYANAQCMHFFCITDCSLVSSQMEKLPSRVGEISAVSTETSYAEMPL